MRFSLLHKGITYLISGLGLWALSLGGELQPVLLLLIAVGFVASWFAEGPRIASTRWSRGWTTAVVALLGVQALRALTGEPPFGLAIEFAAFLTLSRLFNRRAGADYQQITVLAFLHLIAGTVLTAGLGYAFLFVAFVVVTPWMLALTHLRVEIEANYPVEHERERSAKVARVLSSRRIVGPAFLAWTMALSVPLFVSTVAMFVLFPRVGFGLVGLGGRRGQSVTGFGEDIELGGFGVIRDDPTVVLRVTPDRDISPFALRRMLRLRGTAFDHYDGRRWTRTETERKRLKHIGEYYPLKRPEKPSDVRVRIVLEGLEQPVLFVPEGVVGLRIPYLGTAGARHSRSVTRGGGFDLRYSSQDDVGLVYEAVMGATSDELGLPVAADESLARYLQLPTHHKHLVDYARRLTKDDPTPADKARTLLNYLRDPDRFTYTLEQPDPGRGPPLDAFIFGHKRGHCEYFATALAILLRAVGVPTRNVTGYVGGTYNPYGNYFAVQQGQAHSWVEALMPGRGWVTLDPTPAARDAAQTSRNLLTVARELIDAARTYWLMEVVGYDLRTQLRGLRTLRRWFKGFSSLGGAAPKGVPEASREEAPVDAALGGVVVVAVLLFGGALWFWWRLRRGSDREPRRVARPDAERARALYLSMEAALSRRGCPRPACVTPEAHAAALAQQGFDGAPTVARVTQLYVAARYGGEPLSDESVRSLSGEIDALKRTG